MISLVDMRPAWGRPTGAQQRRLPLRQEHLAEIIDPAKNLDDPIQHHRLRHSATAAYLKKLFSHNPLIARKLLIRVIATNAQLMRVVFSQLAQLQFASNDSPTVSLLGLRYTVDYTSKRE